MALTNRIENKTLCRTLNFGKCRIKEEDKQFLRKEFESLRKSESNKWNFDFYNERPIKEGRYEWKRVAGDSFYINPNKAWTFNAKDIHLKHKQTSDSTISQTSKLSEPLIDAPKLERWPSV